MIPTYNRANLLSQTIGSVLVQTYRDFELIVVDDGSTDATQEVVRSRDDSRIRYYFQENAGGPAARNRGGCECRTPYVVFLDSDDLLRPDALANLMSVAAKHMDADLIGGGYEYLDAKGSAPHFVQPWLLGEQLDMPRWLMDCPFIPSATLVRRESFMAVGGFDREQEAAQDWDLWLRMAAHGCSMRWAKEIICQYRLHEGGLTNDIQRQKRGYLRALSKHACLGVDSHEWNRLCREAYANAHLHAAAREYASGNNEVARQDVRLAASYAPHWINSGVLLEILLRKGENPQVANDLRYFESTVKAHLPEGVLPWRSQRRGVARVRAATLFRDMNRCSHAQRFGLWWQIVWHDPAWLSNPGFVCLGFQFFLGRGVVSVLRRLIASRRGIVDSSNASQ